MSWSRPAATTFTTTNTSTIASIATASTTANITASIATASPSANITASIATAITRTASSTVGHQDLAAVRPTPAASAIQSNVSSTIHASTKQKPLAKRRPKRFFKRPTLPFQFPA
jgi:hypothetical protein